MSHKSFNTKPLDVREPVTFDIDGEKFTCHDHIPVSVLLRYASLLMSMPTDPKNLTPEQLSDVAIKAVDVLDFFRTVMDEPEYERFKNFIDDPKRNVDIDTLGELLVFLVEAYGDHPTQPPSG